MSTEEVAKATLEGALDALGTKRDQLNAITVALAEQIKLAERTIASLRVGVTGQVVMHQEANGALWFRLLRFEKYEKEWRLMIASGREDREGWDEHMPLVNAPRSVRLAALDHLPQLVINMIENVDVEIAAVGRGIEQTGKFVLDLDAKITRLAKAERLTAAAKAVQPEASVKAEKAKSKVQPIFLDFTEDQKDGSK